MPAHDRRKPRKQRKAAPPADLNTLMEQLRTLLHTSPSRAGWHRLGELLIVGSGFLQTHHVGGGPFQPVQQTEVVLRALPDGTQTLMVKLTAVAKSEFNLRRYPFDNQRLEAVFEVPQRPLALNWFVDRTLLRAVMAQRHQEGGVGAPGHAALDLDVALHQEGDRVVDRLVPQHVQFIRGHACPSGSIGSEHHWQSGRPAATIWSA